MSTSDSFRQRHPLMAWAGLLPVWAVPVGILSWVLVVLLEVLLAVTAAVYEHGVLGIFTIDWRDALLSLFVGGVVGGYLARVAFRASQGNRYCYAGLLVILLSVGFWVGLTVQSPGYWTCFLAGLAVVTAGTVSYLRWTSLRAATIEEEVAVQLRERYDLSRLQELLKKLDRLAWEPSDLTVVFRKGLSACLRMFALLIGFMLFLLAAGVGSQSHFWVDLSVAILLAWPTARVYSLGKRIGTLGTARDLKSAGRPLILLQRSFRDDMQRIKQLPFYRLRSWVNPWRKTLEEVIANKLSQFGPLLSIGRPGELVPPAGFARFWLSDDHWQEVTEECYACSQLVVLILGPVSDDQTGIGWELSRILQTVPPERIVIIVPPLDQYWRIARWEGFWDLANGRIPDDIIDRDPVILTFGHDWSCLWKAGGHKVFNEEDYIRALDWLVAEKKDALVMAGP